MTEALKALEERVANIQRDLDGVKRAIVELKIETPAAAAPEPERPPKPGPIGPGGIRVKVSPPVVETVSGPIIQSELDELKALLAKEEWPHAINPSLICDISSEQDKQDRAEGILDIIIDVHMEGLKFLDFGCGEGHVVAKARTQNPELSMGYDIQQSGRWTEFSGDKTKYTTDWEEVVKNGPYNVILMYDVIDHIVNEEPVDVLKKLRSLLKPNGKVFVRCHPFSARHSTHLYHSLNKAYAHLVFSNEELEALGYKTTHKVRKIIHPLLVYGNIFSRSGFAIQGPPQIQREPVEPFFVNNPLVAKRIKAHWSTSHEPALRSGQGFPFVQMEQQFLDYVLL